MTHPLIAANFHLALYISGDISSKIAFHLEIGVDIVPEPSNFIISQLPDS
jgi:hypothetical protein